MGVSFLNSRFANFNVVCLCPQRRKTYDNKGPSGPAYEEEKHHHKSNNNRDRPHNTSHQQEDRDSESKPKALSLQQQQHLAHLAYQFPVPEKGRKWTVSIALPGSILDGSLTVELKTYLVGQVKDHFSTVFHVILPGFESSSFSTLFFLDVY